MKLIYRGASYDYNPSHSRLGNAGQPARSNHAYHAPYTLIYRGSTTFVDPEAASVEGHILPAAYELIYRGTTYRINRNASGVATVVSPADRATLRAKPVSIPSTLPKHYISKVHQANLLENLQRRLLIAQERGDQHLVDLLESERRQILA
ncbi:MAG: DUF4278 domain-containing protein [Leptolyngbyaceae cyanobacterium CRU_2_3]|nr:DUF4278 domain-containing protein [Leptolyngbyaceae cyanobacterium CRU_2_3]